MELFFPIIGMILGAIAELIFGFIIDLLLAPVIPDSLKERFQKGRVSHGK